MKQTTTLDRPPLELEHAAGTIEQAWTLVVLATQPAPERARLWHARWAEDGTAIRGLEHLVVLLSALSPDGGFAGVTDPETARWAQSKRIGDRWVLELHDGHGHWPRVVVPAQGDDAVFAALDTASGVLWSHQAVAGLVWGWVNGTLLDGYALVEAPE